MSTKRKSGKDILSPGKRSMSAIKRGTDRVKDFLNELSLGAFLQLRPPRQVVTFDVDTTIGEALLRLDQCRILSAPLFDRKKGEYYGFVDRWDILRQVLQAIDLKNMQHEELSYRLKKLGDSIQTETLSVLSSLEDGELIYKANESHSLYDLVRYGFSRTHGKGLKDVCHRIAVFDFGDCHRSSSSETLNEAERSQWTEASESCSELNVEVTRPLQVQNIVSQSDVLKLLERHKHLFEDILSLSVAELQLAEKPVVCVPVDMTAVHAFASMFAFHVTSVGVVDNRNGGVLVANFSASDLRGIHTNHFPLLSLPVLTYLRKKQALSNQTSVEGEAFLEDWGLSGEDNANHPPADAIYPESTLREAIEHIVQNAHHRVYVKDHDGRPKGIITITDILRLFL